MHWPAAGSSKVPIAVTRLHPSISDMAEQAKTTLQCFYIGDAEQDCNHRAETR